MNFVNLSFSFPRLTQDCFTPFSCLNVNQLHFTRNSAVDINDVIIIKFIAMYYCLHVCSIHSLVRLLCMLKLHAQS